MDPDIMPVVMILGYLFDLGFILQDTASTVFNDPLCLFEYTYQTEILKGEQIKHCKLIRSRNTII